MGRYSGFYGALTLLATIALFVSGCGSFDQEAVVDAYLEDNPNASTEEGFCVVDRLLETYDGDRLTTELVDNRPDNAESNEERSFGDAVTSDDLVGDHVSSELQDDLFRATFACGDISGRLADELIASEIPPDEARCAADILADELVDGDIDSLLSGEPTEQLTDKFTSALTQCQGG